jgi:hypothetical protein
MATPGQGIRSGKWFSDPVCPGESRAPARFYSFTDAEKNTREQIQKARSHPWIAPEVPRKSGSSCGLGSASQEITEECRGRSSTYCEEFSTVS